jgi:hypothetical protein
MVACPVGRTRGRAVILQTNQPTKGTTLIYAITTGDNVVALTDNKNNLDRVRADSDFSSAEIRWATPTEAASFRTLLAAEQRKRWPVLRWFAWLWPVRVAGL